MGCQRTPPPSARLAIRTDLNPEELVERSEGFLVERSASRPPPETHRVRPVGGSRVLPSTRASAILRYGARSGLKYAAPTKTEYAQRQAKEARTIKGARKSTKKASGVDSKGNPPKELGAYPDKHQEIMFLMRASIQHDFQIARAKVFTQKFTALDVEEVVSDDFERTLKKTSGQLRTAGQDDIKAMVALYYNVKEGDIEGIDWMQQDNQFLCPGGNTAPGNLFDIELMTKVLSHLYFGTSRRIGYLFMHLLVDQDDQELLEDLLLAVGMASDDPSLGPSILDRSTEAACGPSLAAIAFAGIIIYHALERLKVPKQTRIARPEKGEKKKKRDRTKKPATQQPRPQAPEFVEEKYAERWNEYVCALAEHPRLGILRASFLAELKDNYLADFSRGDKPVGSDHLW
ncbi:cardiomyopathy-associated protein 5 [Ceratobasidium sp. AG-Ba]|nr:cardiomyopathy-associated protein 5 [Ceratobasidium sp. AG-Ba]